MIDKDIKKRPTRLIAFVAICLLTACQSNKWFQIAHERGLDSISASELEFFWPVIESEIANAAEQLEEQAFISISVQEAQRLLGFIPKIQDQQKFFLIRAINVMQQPIPLSLYYKDGVVHIDAGTFSTCYLFKPTIRKQPLVIALSSPLHSITMNYTCDGL